MMPVLVPRRPTVRTVVLTAAASLFVTTTPATAQQPTTRPPQGQGAQQQRQPVKVNQARAESLYVSADPADHPQRDFARDMAAKARTDSIYTARSRGVMEFTKIKYRSRAGDMDVPAYLFAPLTKRGARGHAAMVWVHGGVHGDWGTSMFPFVKEAVQRGLTVKELVVEKGLLEGRELEEVLDLRAMTEFGVPGGKPIPAGG